MRYFALQGGEGFVALKSYSPRDPQYLPLYAFVPREGERPHLLQRLEEVVVGRFVPDLERETRGLQAPPLAPNVDRPARLAVADEVKATIEVYLGRRCMRVSGFGERLARAVPGLRRRRDAGK